MTRRRSANAAQSLVRRLSGTAGRRADEPQARRPAPLRPAPPQPPPEHVDDAELDQLRAELVRELDSCAARDGGGSATFRRVA